jgi:hypothetical protein
MARVWQEGFEDYLPHSYYRQTGSVLQLYNDIYMYDFLEEIRLGSGRNSYSQNSLYFYLGTTYNPTFTKIFSSSYSEIYFRCYFKFSQNVKEDTDEIIWFSDTSNSKIFSLYHEGVTGIDDFAIYAKTGGTYAKTSDLIISNNIWHKLDVYFKCSATVGAYTVKIDNVIVALDSGINTGVNELKYINFGQTSSYTSTSGSFYIDDIALNDTSGTVNNSWCGNGTIIGLHPNGAGNYTQFTNSTGYVLAENSTTTTNIEITGHGLTTNDVVYNVNRNAYRLITVVDENNFTVSSVTGQTENDKILCHTYQATITAESGTNTSSNVLPGHNLQPYDAIVNTSRSNAIRRVLYTSGKTCVNSSNYGDYEGNTITSQAAGDTIKTYKIKQFNISNHYETINHTLPNPQYSSIQSSTPNVTDTFDIETLQTDKLIPSSASVISVSLSLYARDNACGSNIKPVLRSGSTDNEGDTITLDIGTYRYNYPYNVSPFTSSRWTLAEIDSIEAGVKVV